MDDLKAHDVVRVLSGKYEGLVGYVTDTAADESGVQQRAMVKIAGVKDDEPVELEAWFKRSQLERSR